MDHTFSPAKPAARALAAFAASLAYEDIPAPVLERAKQCLIDAVACAMFGQSLPWSQILLAQTGLDTKAGFLAHSPVSSLTTTREAALCWGAQSHTFELDSLSQPSVGVHPGATIALPALAVAQALGLQGRDLLRAIVAGFEVMHRIGSATLHTPEKRGFHAPGIVGPFGAAIASGLLMKLSADQLTQAMGVAGSLGSGLLAFSKADSGGMVKRLHMGRAAESGVLAAQLAAGGYEGPATVLDGAFGTLAAYCNEHDATALTTGLGSVWQTNSLAIKSFACHITAHVPVHMLRAAMAQHGFTGDDIAALRLNVSEKVLSHHTSRQPADIMQLQYSVPYVVALAAYRDPADPANFRADAIAEAGIRQLAEKILLEPQRKAAGKPALTEISITLLDGRRFEDAAGSFLGCPDNPLSTDQLRAKFLTLTNACAVDAEALFDALNTIDTMADVGALWNNQRPDVRA